MSTEEFHRDLISRLDPETVEKALERYNRKHSSAGIHTASERTLKDDDSQGSTPSILPKIRKNSIQPRYTITSRNIFIYIYIYS